MLKTFVKGALAGAAGLVLLVLTGTLADALAETSAPPPPPPRPMYALSLARNDLANLREVCGRAVKGEALTLEQVVGIGQYCQDLLVRIGAALEAGLVKEPGEAPKESK